MNNLKKNTLVKHLTKLPVDKRGRWMLVTIATINRCKYHSLFDHMTPNMLLKLT